MPSGRILQFDGTVHKKTPLRLHFDERWAPLLTKLLPTEIVRTDDLAIGRSAHAGQGGMVEAANALRARLRSNEREETDRDYIESCFGRSIYGPQQLALIEQQHCTGNHLGCHLWFTRGTQPVDRRGAPRRSILPSRRRSRRGSTAPPTPGTANSIRARCCA